MKQDILTKALNIINNRNFEAERLYREKIAPLYEDNKYVETEQKYTRLIIENAKNEVYGKPINKNLEEQLKKELETIKEKHNLKDLKPNYTCKTCKDTGYIGNKFCSCLKKELSNILSKESGFLEFHDFDNAIKTAGEHTPVYKKMQEWCHSEFNKNLIYFAGPTGSGKTYLMQCMASELINLGKIVKFIIASKLSMDFKEFNKTNNEELLKKYIECEVLFIDDLGTEPIFPNSTLENLYTVINTRKVSNLPTVITSNLNLQEIQERYGERIFSRIADREKSLTIYLDGIDKRIKIK